MKLPCLDVGCSVGRTTFETAQRCPNQLVVGVDLDFNMLRVAQQALATGTVRYDRRRVGLVYDNREFDVPFGGLENVDFWLCDAMHLPFADRSFANVVGLNVLDCVASPLQFLYEVDRTIAADGWFVMSSPFDWSANATPVEAWLGGHSQRGPDGGSSEKMLEQLLTPGKHAQSVRRMRLQKTIDRLPWKVRLHDRFIAEYMVQLLLAKA